MKFPLPPSRRGRGGFSLIEVALALALVSFVLISIVGLLVVGMKNNQVSAEESRAIGILSAMEADLRNTHPLANDGKSVLYELTLPYESAAPGPAGPSGEPPAPPNISYNSSLVDASVPTAVSRGTTMVLLDDAENLIDAGDSTLPAYQATVIYTQVPTSATPFRTMQARLVVNWPVLPDGDEATISNLTDPSKVRGYVETLVSFPAP